MRELFLAKLKDLGVDSSKFGLHSLCASGASAAANAGVADRLFKRHGRWRTESAKDGYVKDSELSALCYPSVAMMTVVACTAGRITVVSLHVCFGFLLLVFSPGGGWPPSPKYSSMSGPSSFFFSLLSFLSSSRVIPACSIVNDDSRGVHSRPSHSCVIACVMQVREEHAMGHDSGVPINSISTLKVYIYMRY